MFFFRKKRSFNIKVEPIYKSLGVILSISSGEDDILSLPIQLDIKDQEKINRLEQIQLLNDLFTDGKIEQIKDGQYLLLHDDIYSLDEEERKILGIPSKPTEISIELKNKGFLPGNHFEFIVEMSSKQYSRLHKIGSRRGAVIELVTGDVLLLERNIYHFLKEVDDQYKYKGEERLEYFANIKLQAKKLGIPVSTYIEKENYEFIDEVTINPQLTEEGINLTPEYIHDSLDDHTIKQLNKTNSRYLKQGNRRIFVEKHAYKTKEQIEQLEPIQKKDIPKFVQNPEAYIPEEIRISTEDFGDRVKGLGIRVYKAQPYVDGQNNKHGWFDFEAGFKIKDHEGNIISREDESFFDGNKPFKQIDEKTFIEVPDKVDEFKMITKKLQREIKNNQLGGQKSRYILEIFENISGVDYNKPLQDWRNKVLDEKIFDSKSPKYFQAILKDFQREGFKWMKTLHFFGNGGLLADDMGLGKTIQVIAFLSYLKEQNKLTPTIIILPKSLVDNWINEMTRFAPILTNNLYVHMGSRRYKDHRIISKYDLVLTTYHTLTRDQTILGLIDWEIVICDEAQAIKNPSTANSIVVKALKNNGRFALTGTPVENSLSDLWSIVDFVQPGLLGSLKDFKGEYEKQLENERNYMKVQQAIEKKIGNIFLRRTKSSELKKELPQKIEVPLEVAMSKEQKNHYKQIIHQVHVKEMDPLQAIQRLKMLCSHPALLNESERESSVPKLKKTIEILKDIKKKNEKVIIFTEYRSMQAILKKEIIKHFNIDAPIINGGTSSRQKIVDAFNQLQGFGVLILSPKAAGTGLTITGANHVVHYTRWWNPAIENQATDRVYRIGQEKDVYVYFPIVVGGEQGESVEEIINQIISRKKALAENVIVPNKSDSIEKEVLKTMYNLEN